MSEEFVRKSGCRREDYRACLLSDKDSGRFGYLYAHIFLDEAKILSSLPLIVGPLLTVGLHDDLGWTISVLIGVVSAAAIYGLLFLAEALVPEDQLHAGCDGLHFSKKPAWSIRLNYVFIPWTQVVKIDFSRGFEILYSNGSGSMGKVVTDLKIRQDDLVYISNSLLVAKHDGKIPGSIVIESYKPVQEKKTTFWDIVFWAAVVFFIWVGVKVAATNSLEKEYMKSLDGVPSLSNSGPVARCLAEATWSANSLMAMVSYDLDRLPRTGLKNPSAESVSECMKLGKQASGGQP